MTLNDFARDLQGPQKEALQKYQGLINEYLSKAEQHYRDGVTLMAYFQSTIADDHGVWPTCVNAVCEFDAGGIDTDVVVAIERIDNKLAKQLPDFSRGLTLAAGQPMQ